MKRLFFLVFVPAMAFSQVSPADISSKGAASFLLFFHYVATNNKIWKTDRLAVPQLEETLRFTRRTNGNA